MELRELERHIHTLAGVEETDAPLISCCLDLSTGATACRDLLSLRLQLLRESIPARSAVDFAEAAHRLEACLDGDLSARTRGMALFARGGNRPFWLPLQFEVPLPNWIAVGATPNIYHLLELKDNYYRYVILLTTETSFGIIGVNLGSVTEQSWSSWPDSRCRVAQDRTRRDSQNHRRERTRQFIQDQIGCLDRMISARGYDHLILAGNRRLLSAVRKELPKRLVEKLVDAVPTGPANRLADVVASTLHVFLEHEELESQAVAARLIMQLGTHRLAVAGTRASIQAIKAGQARLLVLLKSYDPGQAWECRGCGNMWLTPPPNTCQICRTGRLRAFDTRGELARLAERQQVQVEVVEQNDALMSLGGVGCLLRYSAPANYMPSAA